ncbi:integrase, catalytic region, zinc finger, CCHC-type containing protein [Tanacetum coccineum]
MRDSIFKGPYKRKDIPDPNNESETIPEPISKMSKPNKEQYFADIRVMNYILQGISNDIYNFVDACLDAKQIWARIKSYIPTLTLLSTIRTSHLEFITTRNQAVTQDGRVEIQRKNVGYAGNGNRNEGRKNRNQETNAGNVLVQSIEEYDQNVQRNPRTKSSQGKKKCFSVHCNEKGHYAGECPKPRVRDAKYFREQMLLVTKDEARVHLDEEENDFMLDNAYEDNTLEELNAAVIMMACIQPTDDKSDAKPTYDAEFISEVNASQIDMFNGLLSKSDHEQRHHEKLETIICRIQIITSLHNDEQEIMIG